MIPVSVILTKIPMKIAIGTSLLVIAANSMIVLPADHQEHQLIGPS